MKEAHISRWLADTPCALLIDELNVLELDKDTGPLLTKFLKEEFLLKPGRYFVFSSHVVPSGRGLADFMDSISERGLIIRQLPLIPSMSDTRSKLECPDLTVQQALFRGRVPALIYHTRFSVQPPPFVKRTAAIAEVAHNWDDNMVNDLLASFLYGDPALVPPSLLQLMSVSPEGKIVWIPFHMIHVLESISITSNALSPSVLEVVQTMHRNFQAFDAGKICGGSSWECLFIISAIARVAARQFCKLLPLDGGDFAHCRVSFSSLWGQKQGGRSLPHITTIEQLIEGLVVPRSYPHVAVFYPPHASFNTYDIIVVAYCQVNDRQIFGYQMKEGSALPTKPASSLCQESYVIRGSATDEDTDKLRSGGWKVASDDDIDEFLGVTGRCLAPKEWRSLDAVL